jgi:hypothetical protein
MINKNSPYIEAALDEGLDDSQFGNYALSHWLADGETPDLCQYQDPALQASLKIRQLFDRNIGAIDSCIELCWVVSLQRVALGDPSGGGTLLRDLLKTFALPVAVQDEAFTRRRHNRKIAGNRRDKDVVKNILRELGSRGINR